MRHVIGVTGSVGIGSPIARYVESVGEHYATLFPNAMFRAGNAPGVDQAFQLGVNFVDPTRLTLCLPWPGFEPRSIVEPADWTYDATSSVQSAGNTVLDIKLHGEARHWQLAQDAEWGYWERLGPAAQKLYCRNAMIVDGCTVLLAWPDVSKKGWGGTGHTMRCAEVLDIPVYLLEYSWWWDPKSGQPRGKRLWPRVR